MFIDVFVIILDMNIAIERAYLLEIIFNGKRGSWDISRAESRDFIVFEPFYGQGFNLLK